VVAASRRHRLTGVAAARGNREARPARLLALGDSYTIGEGVAPDAAWPGRLVEALRARGRAWAAPTVIATTGWTTTELADAMAKAQLDPPYDLVTLLVGVNDQYRDWPPDAYPPRHAALLDRAIALAGGAARRCIAVSIPDWGATPFAAGDPRGRGAIAAAIDDYNAMAAANAAARGVRFVDVTRLSRDPALMGALVADGLHPSAEQYQAWVDRAIAPAAVEALGA
jgi:lysophospholipase L1-like esterase